MQNKVCTTLLLLLLLGSGLLFSASTPWVDTLTLGVRYTSDKGVQLTAEMNDSYAIESKEPVFSLDDIKPIEGLNSDLLKSEKIKLTIDPGWDFVFTKAPDDDLFVASSSGKDTIVEKESGEESVSLSDTVEPLFGEADPFVIAMAMQKRKGVIRMVVLIVVLALIALLFIWYFALYNGFVRLKNQAEEASSAIDAHLKQRYDLVPNLVETVKGYAKHEEGTLTAVIEARNAAASASTFADKENANSQLQSTLKSLFALSEAYPDLKANQGFLDLQKQLQTIESDLLNARKYYNAVVKNLNTKCEMFPSSIVANMAHFSKKEYVKIEEEAKARVDVKF